MKVIRSFRSNLIIRGTDIYIAKSKAAQSSGFSHTRENIVSPYAIPSDKKFHLDSTFCKVLSAKSVVFPERENNIFNFYAV